MRLVDEKELLNENKIKSTKMMTYQMWTKKELLQKINLDSREESEVFEDNCSEDDFSKKQCAKGLGVTWKAGQGIPGRQSLYFCTAVRHKTKVLSFSLYVLFQATCGSL